MVWLCEAVLDVVRLTDHFEAHLPRPGGVTVARLPGCPVARLPGCPVARLLGELNAPFDFAQDKIVGQDRVDPVPHRFQQVFQKCPSRPPLRLVDQLRHREFTRAVDAYEQIEPFNKLRRALPSAVCSLAISMWKKPIR